MQQHISNTFDTV